MSTPRPEQARIFPAIPRGEVIGRYEDYLDAQKVVDYLADNDFPVANVSIIGNDLKLVERVRTKLSYPRVAMQGASQGAVIGLFFGLLLFFFTPSDQTSGLSMIAAVLLGAVLFMLMSVVNYALQRGKRDFSSTRQVLPSTWDVVVDRSVAGQAKQLASRLPMHPSQASTVTGWGMGQQPTPPAEPGPTQPPKPSEPSRDYQDLADGRPRYGVRVQPPAAQPPEASQLPEAPQVGQPYPAQPAPEPSEATEAPDTEHGTRPSPSGATPAEPTEPDEPTDKDSDERD